MKENYKIIHASFNNPETLLVANFKWLNEVCFFGCEVNRRNVIGKWNIKYKKS
jgi:hypothetical protein